MLGALRRLPRSRQLILVASVVYLGVLLGFLLFRGISIEPEYVVGALVLVALALGRAKQFLFDFVPFLVLFIGYEVMGGLAGKAGIAPHDTGVLEQWMFGGALPTVWLQSRIYDPHTISLLDWVTMGFYFMHFVLPVVVGFIFWLRDRRLYWTFVAALLGLSVVAFLFFVVFPTAPPWYQYPHRVLRVINLTIQRWGVNYYVSPIFTIDSDKFAAFPSLHAAYPTLAALFAWRFNRVLGVALSAYALCVWFSVVYLGEHYVVDVAAGALLAAAVTFVALRVAGRLFPSKGVGSGPIDAIPPEPESAPVG
ncbi:MAG: phosphatase PAP2 family protein [Candidatus Dormibacteraceae bacterium]